MGKSFWAIGGPFDHGENIVGYGKVDNALSIRAIHRALNMGLTFLDTTDTYGCDYRERILVQALADRRDQTVNSTIFGDVPYEFARRITGEKMHLLITSARRAMQASKG